MKKTVIRNLFSIDQHLELYFELIENNLQYPPEIRERFMRSLKADVSRFVRSHPNAVMSDVCKRFGDPYEQDKAVIKMIEKSHVRKIRKRTALFLVMTIVLVMLLVIAVGFAMHYSSNNDEHIFVSNAYSVIGGVFL